MIRLIVALVMLSQPAYAASLDDLPSADDYRPRAQRAQETPVKRAPTKWKVRLEGEPGYLLLSIPIAKQFGLTPGQTISIEMARLIVEEMGGEYPDDIRENLERLDKLK